MERSAHARAGDGRPPGAHHGTVAVDGKWVAIDALQEGVAVFAPDRSLVAWNSAADQILGTSFPDFVARRDLGLVSGDGRPVAPGDLPLAVARRERRIVTGELIGFLTADGTRRWITVTARPLGTADLREPPEVLVTFTDVTRVREAQQSVDEALALLQRLFETSPVPVGVTRIGGPDDGRFVLVNQAYCDIVGWSEAELLGMSSFDLIHPDDLVASRMARNQLIAGQLPEHRVELRLLNPSGSSVWCLLQRTIVRDAHGVPRFAFGQIEDLTERRAAEATMAEQAMTDWLTGLPNRRSLFERLQKALPAHPGQVGVVFIDLDGFKQVNDRHGHEAGDQALVGAAAHIGAVLGPQATLARLGGDEFVIVIDPISGIGELAALAEALRALEIPSGEPDRQMLRMSVGAVITRPGESPEHVLRRADAAMYQSKRFGAPRPSPSTSPEWV